MNENKYDVKAKSLPRLIINKPKSYEIALKAAIEITFSSIKVSNKHYSIT